MPLRDLRQKDRRALAAGGAWHTLWYATPACRYRCAVKANRTTTLDRRIKRWEHEEVIEAMQARLDRMPGAMSADSEVMPATIPI